MSAEAKNLIVTLLNRNPSNRLGASEEGAEEIKRHPFFATIDWSIVKKRGLPVPPPRHTKAQYLEKFKDIVCTDE
jgi:serine/threonine protein kinase